MIYSPDYYQAVEVSKFRQLMKYDQAAFEADWQTMLACAMLQIEEDKPHLNIIMESCMQRILAWNSNTGDVPWTVEGRDY